MSKSKIKAVTDGPTYRPTLNVKSLAFNNNVCYIRLRLPYPAND